MGARNRNLSVHRVRHMHPRRALCPYASWSGWYRERFFAARRKRDLERFRDAMAVRRRLAPEEIAQVYFAPCEDVGLELMMNTRLAPSLSDTFDAACDWFEPIARRLGVVIWTAIFVAVVLTLVGRVI